MISSSAVHPQNALDSKRANESPFEQNCGNDNYNDNKCPFQLFSTCQAHVCFSLIFSLITWYYPHCIDNHTEAQTG